MGIRIRKRHLFETTKLARKMETAFQVPFASSAWWLCAGYRQHRFTWSSPPLRSCRAWVTTFKIGDEKGFLLHYKLDLIMCT